MNDEEIKYVNYQLIGLGLTIVTTIVAILITYNQKLHLEGKKELFNSNKSLKITKINRTTILLIGILFLYINYKLYKISKEEGENLKSYKLQITASSLTTISAIIALYVVYLSNTETIADVENPTI